MSLDNSQVWAIVHVERGRLATDLAAVDDDGWTTPSLCAGWTVHDVLAHLVDTAKTTRLGFLRRMLAARMDFDADNTVGVHRERRGDPQQTLAAFRAVTALTLTPPAPRATRLVEAFVHGEDIRRPLGIVGDYPADAVAEALRYQATASAAVGGGRDRVRGLRLIATDTDCQIGEGREVRGRAIDLLMMASGRL